MKQYFILLIVLCISCNNNYQKKDVFKLQLGDLLFQDLDSSPLCDAIELVTPGYKNANFSHIGIVTELGETYCISADYNYDHHIRVLEAIPDKVKTTRLDSFINRSFDQYNKPKVIVGRLKTKYQYTIQDAISFLENKIGKKYDNAFIVDNNSYYCSELIYEAFLKDSIFTLEPMNFLHPTSKDTIDTWKKHYSKIGMPIPQNQMGINPGIMSLSEKIDIVHTYGFPDGMKK